MDTMHVSNFHGVCAIVVKSCPDPWAKTYANAGLGMTRPTEVRTQCLYILNNMKYWRGDVARECRNKLNMISRL